MNVYEDGVITVPTIMWVKALDMLLEKLKVMGTDFASIAAVSGTAQVSVFLFLKASIYLSAQP